MSQNRNIKEQFNHYSKEVVPGLQVDKKTFKNVIKKFSVLVADKLLEAEEVKIPIMGTLRIKKCKQSFEKNKLKVDFQATKKEGKLMYHTNDHRNGYFYRFMWKKNPIINISYYSFVPERYYMKRRLAKTLKSNSSVDFFEN